MSHEPMLYNVHFTRPDSASLIKIKLVETQPKTDRKEITMSDIHLITLHFIIGLSGYALLVCCGRRRSRKK